MKIAITSSGNSLESTLDSRFGRSSYFAIYDSETEETSFFLNPNKENQEGAGPASAQFVASKGVQKIISGAFGGKVKAVLDSLKIELIALKESNKTIAEIIETVTF